MIVVDASAVAALLLNLPRLEKLRERLGGEELHAPHLIDLEVTQVLRRAVRRGGLSERAAASRLAALSGFPLERYAHTLFLKRAWQLKDNLTSYDAAYVALAETLGAPLITLDAPLSRAPGHHARVEFYSLET